MITLPRPVIIVKGKMYGDITPFVHCIGNKLLSDVFKQEKEGFSYCFYSAEPKKK